MILNVPITLIDTNVYVKVEIQIRSLAMDFWASIEHKLKYKKNINSKTSKELIECAQVISNLDDRMQLMKENSLN